MTLIETLEKAGAEVATKETGTYYKTILGTIQHCFWYEVSWLKRYKALGDYPSLRATVLDEEIEALKAKVGEDLPARDDHKGDRLDFCLLHRSSEG